MLSENPTGPFSMYLEDLHKIYQRREEAYRLMISDIDGAAEDFLAANMQYMSTYMTDTDDDDWGQDHPDYRPIDAEAI